LAIHDYGEPAQTALEHVQASESSLDVLIETSLPGMEPIKLAIGIHLFPRR
jgi:hypothetical protein